MRGPLAASRFPEGRRSVVTSSAEPSSRPSRRWPTRRPYCSAIGVRGAGVRRRHRIELASGTLRGFLQVALPSDVSTVAHPTAADGGHAACRRGILAVNHGRCRPRCIHVSGPNASGGCIRRNRRRYCTCEAHFCVEIVEGSDCVAVPGNRRMPGPLNGSSCQRLGLALSAAPTHCRIDLEGGILGEGATMCGLWS
jgi:hypothetical protein